MGPNVPILTLLLWLLPAMVLAAPVGQHEEPADQGERPCDTYIDSTDNQVYVDCSDRGLSELSDDINVQVTVLDISNNNFGSFPPQLKNFTNLQKLDLSSNYLTTPLPTYMNDLNFLHTLNLSNNNYDTWLSSGNSSSIRVLDLSKNKINRIEEAAIAEIKNINILDLSENRINDLPSTIFSTATCLETLVLTRNYFSEVPKFKSSSLKHLYLNNCQVTKFDVDSFDGMNSLLGVDLSINQIESIPDNLDSKTLQELDLSYNEVGMLTDRTFSSLPNLAVLNLRGNEFREVWPSSHFASNAFLREIHVKGNRWSCEGFSVNLLLTYEFLTREPPKIGDRASLICYSPSNVTQMSWQEAYIKTWHSVETAESFTVIAIMIGIIIGIVLTLFVCRALMAINKPDPPRQTAETTVLNLNGSVGQPRVEDVVMRVPLQEEDLPPSYDEALLMPRLNSSFHSLPDFVDEDFDHRRRYRRSRSIGDLTEPRPRAGDRRSVRRVVDIHISDEIT